MHCYHSLAVNRLVARGCLLSVVAILSTIYTFHLVMCRQDVFVFASAINKVDCRAAQPCWRCFLQWRHKSLWPMHLLRWRSQRVQFHCRQFGTLLWWWGMAIGTINFMASTLVSLWLSKVVAQSLFLAGARRSLARYTLPYPIVARGSVSPCTKYAVNLPLWQGAHCCTQTSCNPWQAVRCCPLWQRAHCCPSWRMRPPQQSCCTCFWCCTCHLWRTCCTHLRQRTHFFQRTPQTGPWRICAAGCCMAWYGRRCILQMTIWNFDCCVAVVLVLPLHLLFYCHCSLQDDIKKWLLHCQHYSCGFAINIVAARDRKSWTLELELDAL